MKSIIKYSFWYIMASCTLLIVINIGNTTVRSNEAEDSTAISMRNTVKGVTLTKMDELSEEEMRTTLIRDLIQNTNTEETLEVVINKASTKGLLDLKLRSHYKNLNGEDGISETRKTLILEETPVEP